MAQLVSTLDDIINREDRYDIEKVGFYSITDDHELVTLDSTLIDLYMKYVREYVGLYRVSKKEREYYRFRPQLLSLDIFGTSSLDWLIMKLNDKECSSKFYIKSTIRLVPKNVIEELYTTIATKSRHPITQNRNDYLRLVGENVANVVI